MKTFIHKVTPFSGADTATVTIGESNMTKKKQNPEVRQVPRASYILEVNDQVWLSNNGSAETMTDDEFIHRSFAGYSKTAFVLPLGYVNVPRTNGVMWRKVNA